MRARSATVRHLSSNRRTGGAIVRASAAALLLALLAAPPAAGSHPNQPQGFAPDRAYQGLDQIDQIDLFSGRLSLTVPIGPFTLFYNSNVWRYELRLEDGEERIRATPDRTTTAGLGWHLGWGEVYHPDHPLNDTEQWLYVDNAAARHVFYQSLHRGENDGDTAVLYSRDGSYLRLRLGENNCYADIEQGDGTTRRFVGSCGPGTTFRLTKVWSPFASAADPDMTIAYDADDFLRTITDRYGRTHRVYLADQLNGTPVSWLSRVITRVEVESFQGQTAAYDLHYANHHVNVSCKNTSDSMPARIRVPHLTRIDLPDGSAFAMEEAGEPMYYNLCEGGIDDLPGALRGIDLPTGGKLRWSFQEYSFPPGPTVSVFNTSAGVAERRTLDAGGAQLGVWTYRTSSIGAAGGNDPELHTEVVYPTGGCSKHFFDGRYWVSPAEGKGWEYGLPFVPSEQHGGRYLSKQTWSSSSATGACAGTKLRSTYVRYRHDALPGSAAPPLVEWYHTNREIEARRRIYHDDGDRYADLALSEHDGLGHFRRRVESGDFRSSANDERRQTVTEYDRVSGVYGQPGYQPPAPSEPWVLSTVAAVEVSEPDAVGESSRRIEYGVEPATGFVSCSRVLAAGTTRGSGDLVTVFVRDARGLVIDVKQYGGDRQPLWTAGAGCGQLPAQPAYWTHYGYQHGVRTTIRPRYPNGTDGPYPTYDVDIDPATGLVTARRDPAGRTLSYDYDVSGRVTSVTPADGAVTTHLYTGAAGGQPARVTTVVLPAAGGAPLLERETVYDDFGRLRLERRKLPGGVWSERETVRNARGWVTSVSEWGSLAKRTRFRDFDAFGRPATIRPPGGAGGDVRLTYSGERRVVQESKVAMAGGEAYVARAVEKDRYGRTRTVLEPSGAGGAQTATTFDYDVGGRTTRILTGSAPGPVQARHYSYDNRGFLLSETLPEKGPSGMGSVHYQDYDARGRYHRRIDGPHDLMFTYDFMGRARLTRDRNHGDRLVTNIDYDQAPGGAGKMWRAIRHNYLQLPWNPGVEEDVRVVQTYAYLGPGGAVTRKATAVYWSLDDVTFEQAFGHDQLGNATAIGYPRCTLAACAGTSAGDGRQLDVVYQNGRVAAVDGWVDAVDFHASGAWRTIHHANGVVDHQEVDADHRQRPRRRYTTGVAAGDSWDTGTIAYDGSGNVAAMTAGSDGASHYTYDAVGRLAGASLFDGFLTQTYSYDPFGNLTAKATDGATVSYTVDAASNRLSGAVSYDAAGNLTAWGGTTFRYDTSNRLIAQAHMQYLYDADGERTVSIANLPAPNAVFHLRGLERRLLSTISLSTQGWRREQDYIHAGDRLVAAAAGPSGAARHYHLDHLGSPRLITGAGGAALASQHLLPYGEEYPETSTFDNRKLAGHERDFSTDADYLHARHYHAGLGRFLSVDPVHGEPSLPQRLNRYAYVTGKAMTQIDPDGRSGDISYEDLGGFGVVVANYDPTVNPLSLLEHAWVATFLTGSSFVLGPVSDLAFAPFRLIPSVNQAFLEISPGLLPITDNMLALSFEYWTLLEHDAYQLISNWTGAPIPGEEPDVDVDGGAELDTGPHDPQATYSDEIVVVSPQEPQEPQEPSEISLPGDGTLICGATICIEVQGEINDQQKQYLRDYVRAEDGFGLLREFHCQVSPITCTGRIGWGTGGGSDGWHAVDY